MKFIVNSSVPETDLSELKDLVAFLDSIEKRQILIELQQKQEESKRYLKKIKIGNKSEKKKKHWLMLRKFLTEEMILLNL